MTTKRFESNVVRTGTKTYVHVPFDPNDEWGWKVRHYVKGTETRAARIAEMVTMLEAGKLRG